MQLTKTNSEIIVDHNLSFSELGKTGLHGSNVVSEALFEFLNCGHVAFLCVFRPVNFAV